MSYLRPRRRQNKWTQGFLNRVTDRLIREVLINSVLSESFKNKSSGISCTLSFTVSECNQDRRVVLKDFSKKFYVPRWNLQDLLFPPSIDLLLDHD